MKTLSNSAIVLFCVAAVLFFGLIHFGFSGEENFIGMKLGGIQDIQSGSNSNKLEGIARFAVEERNKRENGILELKRVLKAKEQVVAGTLYHLTLEVADGEKNRVYEARVWEKPWMNFKELQDFKLAGSASSRR